MIKNKPTHSTGTIKKKILFVLGFALIVYLIFLYFPYYLFAPHHGEVETKKNEQNTVPQEVTHAHPVASSSASYEIPILMYHYVEIVKDPKDTIRQSLDILPNAFAAQVQTLKQNNFTFLTMAEVADIIDGVMPLPKRPVVITFDDGYRDFYTDVFPIITKEKIPVVAYLVPGFFDQPNYLLTSQVKEIAKSPYVEIGAHTMHHVWLKGVSPVFAQREIAQSKYQLEDLIHKPVVSFAYPYGAFDNNAIDLVKKAGFRTAVSTIPGMQVTQENRFFLFRIRPGYRTGMELVDALLSPSAQ
ncbi:MAG TPA: polysaccharide deacetylase family protein [Patescibacteria group bacterium]|nr:polysaccharide deacetylase family protein [Patescibacteria group bacterium]